MMTRRGFLARLVAVPAAALVAPTLAPRLNLAFDSRAFAAMDFETGIAVRYIRSFRPAECTRLDVLFGAPQDLGMSAKVEQ
jgi:hypothetical protein